LFKNWIKVVNNQTKADIDLFLLTSVLHSQFEAMYPFIDGNGRTRRILIVLFLVYKQILFYPSIFISDQILQIRIYYCLYLQESQIQKNYLDLAKYLTSMVSKKADNVINSILAILEMKREWSLKIKD